MLQSGFFMLMETHNKHILVRNSDTETIADHINSFIEVSTIEGGKKCIIELYKDSIDEHVLLFPNNIPYFSFHSLLSAIDAPWINNAEGIQAAGWATHNGEELLLYTPKAETGLILAISDAGKLYTVDGEENTAVEAEKLPLEYFTYAYDKAKLEKVAEFELLLDDNQPIIDPEDIVEEFEEVSPEEPKGPVKVISPLFVVGAIVIISALLIWLISLAG